MIEFIKSNLMDCHFNTLIIFLTISLLSECKLEYITMPVNSLGFSDYRGSVFASILLDDDPISDTIYIQVANKKDYLIYRQYKTLNGNFISISIHQQDTFKQGSVLLLDSQRIISIYNLNLTELKGTSSPDIQVICYKFSSSKSYFYYMGQNRTSGDYMIFRYHLQFEKQVTSIVIQRKPVLFQCTSNSVYVHAENMTYIYDQKLNFIRKFRTDNYRNQIRTIQFQGIINNFTFCKMQIESINKTDYMFVKYNSQIHVWDLDSKLRTKVIQLIGHVMDFVYCNDKLYVITQQLQNRNLIAINTSNWKIYEQQILTSNNEYQLFCSQNTNDKFLLIQIAQENWSNDINSDQVIQWKNMTNENITIQNNTNIDDLTQTINFQEFEDMNVQNHQNSNLTDSKIYRPQLFGTASAFVNISSSLIPFFANTGQAMVKFLNFNIDFFWLYGYHETNYSHFVWQFSQQMDLLSELRLSPQFIQYFDLENKIGFKDQNALYLQVMTFRHNVPKKIFFLESIKGVYTNGLLISASTTLLFLFMRLLFRGQECLLCLLLHNFFLTHCKWWMIAISVFQTHLSFGTFYAFYQLTAPFSFNFISKINLITTVIMLFFFLLYAFTFIPLMKYLEEDSQSQKIIDITHNSEKGFLLTSILSNTSTFVRAQIHCICLSHNNYLLIGLIIMDAICLAACFYYRKTFKRLFFIMTVLFICSMIIFDLVLLLKVTEVEEINYETATMFVVFTLIGLYLLRILFVIGQSIFQLVKGCYNGNRVQDLSLKEDKQDKQEDLKSAKKQSINLPTKNMNQPDKASQNKFSQKQTQKSLKKEKKQKNKVHTAFPKNVNQLVITNRIKKGQENQFIDEIEIIQKSHITECKDNAINQKSNVMISYFPKKLNIRKL